MANRQVQRSAKDEKQVAYGARFEKRQEQARRRLVTTQLATVEGREYVWSELTQSGMFDLMNGATIEQTWMFLGRRQAGIERLLELQQHHATEYELMHKEAIQRKVRLQHEIDSAHLAQDAQKDETDTES